MSAFTARVELRDGFTGIQQSTIRENLIAMAIFDVSIAFKNPLLICRSTIECKHSNAGLVPVLAGGSISLLVVVSFKSLFYMQIVV